MNPRSTRTGLAVLAAGASLLLLTACGGGEAKDSSDKAKGADKVAEVTDVMLDAALLKAADLGEGWKDAASLDTGTAAGGTVKPEQCRAIGGMVSADGKAAGARAIRAGHLTTETGGAVSPAVYAFEDGGAAKLMADFDKKITDCATYELNAPGGAGTVKMTTAAATAPTVAGADQVVAFKATMDIGMKFGLDVVLIRKGDAIAQVGVMDSGSGTSKAEDLAKGVAKAGEKLVAAVK
ncbi:hypothetical protein ACN20G_18165 [Streptomyces sp. BI20]|uniref:hypothetical protein n=1 Tax=Streptomyces sp. BI20 TaxID=3403460 RepID=UPI003C75089B